MTSYVTPTESELDIALPLLSSPQHEAYFFSRLQNPLWIRPLSDRKVFDHPLPREEIEGGYVRFPAWPPSQYLARMASLAPKEVVEIFSRLETNNSSIVKDLLEAAAALPLAEAAALVSAVRRAAQAGTLRYSFDEASTLCARLAEGGYLDGAKSLATSLFRPNYDLGAFYPGRNEEYQYYEGMKKVVPALSKNDPAWFLPKLCKWLESAIREKGGVHRNNSVDTSRMWRPAVEEHTENPDYDFAGIMVGLVRQGFEEAIRAETISLEEAIAVLSRFARAIFGRVAIHLANEFADRDAAVARQTILNRVYFDGSAFAHEYARLLTERFALLDEDDRRQWFEWVNAGPELSRLSARHGTDREVADYANRWKLNRLHLVQPLLSDDVASLYDRLRREYGEPADSDLSIQRRFGRLCSESPMTVEELEAMSFGEAVRTVSAWHPKNFEFDGPGVEGLASTFKQYLSSKGDDLSRKSVEMIGAPAVYVRAYLQQMSERAREGRTITLTDVLDLCEWVVEQPIDDTVGVTPPAFSMVDRNWQWTRDTISELVQNVCRSAAGENHEIRNRVIQERIIALLCLLARDGATSYLGDQEDERDPRTVDYLTRAINSPRGKAMEATMAFVSRILTVRKDIGEGLVGFQGIEKIKEILEWQVVPENQTVEALAVIGSRLNLLHAVDSAWLDEIKERLFNLTSRQDESSLTMGWAAWNSYLVWGYPHIAIYRMLLAQFREAVTTAEQIDSDDRHEAPLNHLGEHLMVLYIRGDIDLDNNDGPLRRFILNARSNVRRHAIGFVGNLLSRGGEINDAIRHRLTELWELYWAGPGKDDAREKPNAWLFGTWFSSGVFDDTWALDRLNQFVDVSPTAEPDEAIARELARLSPGDPLKSVQILDRMIRGDKEGWRIHGWLDEARTILQTALANENAHETASDLLNFLARRGYQQFRDLYTP